MTVPGVDGDLLRALAPRVSGRAAARQARIIGAVGPVLATTLDRAGINTPLRIAHFLAQIAHESDGFCTTEEYASGANYEGRDDLGNTQPGDGRRFKGRGLIQLTGRHNYAAFGERVGVNPIADPERAAEPILSLRLACEYWNDRGLSRKADHDELEAITRRINGGLNGLADRRRYLTIAKGLLGVGARPTLRRGDRGEMVRQVQRKLGIAADGIFVRDTEDAVREWQHQRGLTPDGIVGARTWESLVSPPERTLDGWNAPAGVSPPEKAAPAPRGFWAWMRALFGGKP